MTKKEFYNSSSQRAYEIATNICKTRREAAGIPGLCEADIEMESAMILSEWYSDYCNERD